MHKPRLKSKIEFNQKYGDLLPIELVYSEFHKRYLWNCECVCGIYCLVRESFLLSGKRISCDSCSKQRRWKNFGRKSLVGIKFGHLTVQSLSYLKDKYVWRCLCECGNIVELPYKILKTQQVCSNQCFFFKEDISKRNWKGFGEISGAYWNSIKHNARIRNIRLNVTIDYCWELALTQNFKCALSGLEIIFTRQKSGDATASLDRIDNSIGYNVNNVWWVHKDINLIKNKYSIDYFIYICKLVANYSKLEDCINPINYHITSKFKRYVSHIKTQALDSGRLFEFDTQCLLNLFLEQNGKCAFTGLPISFEDKTASLDRINNDFDYLINNVQWVHKNINWMRSYLTVDYFIYLCKMVTANVK